MIDVEHDVIVTMVPKHRHVTLWNLDTILDEVWDLLKEIQQSRKGGIGAPNNVYLPQLRVTRIDELTKKIENILGVQEK
jgi:hypothetical protein